MRSQGGRDEFPNSEKDNNKVKEACDSVEAEQPGLFVRFRAVKRRAG